jgi:type II secretory pathway pseudopilin PulG
MKRFLGFSLVELVFTILILGLFITPIASLFLANRKIEVSAKNLFVAMNLANSMISQLSHVDAASLVEIMDIKDDDLPLGLSLGDLELNACPDGFSRISSLVRKSFENSLGEYYLIAVEIQWNHSFTGQTRTYSLEDVRIIP